MKGGKKGRDAKGSTSSRPGAPRGKPKPGAAKRASDAVPPKKGSRKKPGYGGMSSTGEE